MSDVNPDDLRKVEGVVRPAHMVRAFYVGCSNKFRYHTHKLMPLTQRDLERVAALAMMPPGTTVEGLGYVWTSGDAFTLFYEEPNDD